MDLETRYNLAGDKLIEGVQLLENTSWITENDSTVNKDKDDDAKKALLSKGSIVNSEPISQKENPFANQQDNTVQLQQEEVIQPKIKGQEAIVIQRKVKTIAEPSKVNTIPKVAPQKKEPLKVSIHVDDIKKGSEKVSDAIQTALESGNGSKESQNLKKVLAAVSVSENQYQKKTTDTNPTSLAIKIDEGISRVQAAYDVGAGKKDIQDALDEQIDRKAVYLAQASENAIDRLTEKAKDLSDIVVDKGIDIVVEKIGDTIGKVFPPARAAVPFAKALIDNVKPEVKEVVHKGIDKISGLAKSVVKTGITKVKNFAKKTVSKILNWL